MELDELLKKIESYIDNPDIELIRKAYNFAERAHRRQNRISGEPFIEHPLGVALILADLGLDIISIAGALLHDVVEDTEVTSDEIEREFGGEIALLVDGVTKLTRIKFKSKEEHQAESLRKMFIAMAEDIRVILIKLADRLHNMRTLAYLRKYKQIQKATETIEIYAPLAHRLGMSKIKWELEDLSFRYLDKDMYYEVAKKVAANRAEREKDIKDAIDYLSKKCASQGIAANIYGRPKHLYSIYQKMKRKEVDFTEIYDLTAIRVIVDSVRECYEVLGMVHEIWKPIPGRFKDYIAMPKSNMYQSLHTTVIGPKGDPLEVQIRTLEMHRTAEYGIAAHWRYKEGKTGDEAFEEKLSWLRQLLEWQKDLQEPQEFMEALKIDLFEDEVFVFTPKGDVISLPRGATPVDFAYYIHTEVGHSCVGAKVNGKIKPLEYRLKNGNIVEIQTSKTSNGPSRDWLKYVKTSKARSKIKHWFKQQERDQIIQRGKDLLEKELKRRHIELKEQEKQEELVRIAGKMGKNNVDELLELVGYNQINTQQVISRLKAVQEDNNIKLEDMKGLTKRVVKKSADKGVKVKGIDDLLVRISKCCNPVPGDDITGYITRGRGVSIHRCDCPNLQNLIEHDQERLINVSWDEERSESYEVNLAIEAVNKKALLNDITSLIKEEQINLLSVIARTDKYNRAHIKLVLELSSLEHMRDIISKLGDISGILSVERAKPT
ncbi:RelA/SpoT family protein [Iocasia frigidifontis]|uniref:GTP diphosphokinase n=1 Tax=Iocasia fonsfrigidae TaxID=2682810 RepID=A0A8A7KEC4_9FIRM|nr:bifunctional (p)ppGpp synthetase/guanosine-3',5'-bis(diphosphate) 3'-pyrophosphohydrolase [Iocasia fonsfrigidae]QTL98008.1 RelA/SpoT family protein [Iocasia fonsfrigidae]